MPLRVLHILGSAEREWTGIAELVLGFATLVPSDLYSVDCLFLRPGPLAAKFEQHGIRTHNISGGKLGTRLGDASSLFRFLRREKYDLIHLHNAKRSIQIPVKASGSFVVLHMHAVAQSNSGRPLPLPRISPDATIAVSQAVAELTGSNVIVVRPGIANAQEARRRVEDGSGEPVVGCLGRLILNKGIPVLLRAFAQVLQDVPEARLEIAGDGPALPILRLECESLQIQSKVSFLGWQDAPLELLPRWSVLAHPSLWDAAPVSILQAFSCGVPVVASRVGGIPEMVENGKTGYLFEPGDSDSLAKLLKELLTNTAERQRISSAAQSLASKRFTAESMCQGILSVYDRITGNAQEGN